MSKPAGSVDKHGYVNIRVLGTSYKARRLAWLMKKEKWPPKEIDHRNRKRADNRWRNIRKATKGQNQMNCRLYKNNKSGFKGVTWHPQHKRWYATIQKNKKSRFLGLFDTPKLAHAAYVTAAKKHFGEFARAR